MERERQRVKGYYTPMDQLPEREKIKKREKNRQHAKTFYIKHKKRKSNDGENSTNNVVQANGSNVESNDEENDIVSSTVREEDLLKIKMPFHSLSKTKARKGPAKRQSRALKWSYQRIETLEDQNETLRKKLKTAQKRIQRFQAAKQKQALTPKSKTDVMLKRAGLKPTEVPNIRKQLMYAEIVTEEVKITLMNNPTEIPGFQKVVSGKVIKKYRMRSYLEKMTSLHRRKRLQSTTNKNPILRSRAQKVKSDVKKFLNRDDNSRLMPGKGDSVKVGKDQKQKRILNDYMHNLHLKFISEVDYKISKASFCRLRPKEITLVNFTSRSVCLCAKHQNMGFKLRSLKNLSVCNCTSPDSFVDMYKNIPEEFNELLTKLTQEKIKFQQWKRVKLQNGKERMRIVDVEVTKEEFVKTMKKEFEEFVAHVDRVTKQYKSVRLMKENLPKITY